MKRITRKQFEIVSFIRDFINQNGFSPTLYEIADHFSIRVTTVSAHIAALEHKHAIERRKGTRRSIRLAETGHGKKHSSSVSVPLYAKLSRFPDEPDSRCCIDPGLLPLLHRSGAAPRRCGRARPFRRPVRRIRRTAARSRSRRRTDRLDPAGRTAPRDDGPDPAGQRAGLPHGERIAHAGSRHDRTRGRRAAFVVIARRATRFCHYFSSTA